MSSNSGSSNNIARATNPDRQGGTANVRTCGYGPRSGLQEQSNLQLRCSSSCRNGARAGPAAGGVPDDYGSSES
jgi:hypothetical protein